MELKTLKAHFAAEFIDIEEAAQVDGATWEPFQFSILNNTSRFSCDVKSRQIAWSFTAALDAVCDAATDPVPSPHIFVSINLDEAKEKIRYAKAIIAATDAPVRNKYLRLRRDSQTELEFENGHRLISHPCRPVRGKGRAKIYLDELAHYPNGMDREIYLAATPAIAKGGGYMRLGSSPLGAKGLFWEIATESLKRWPGYVRRVLPWWTIRAFCKDVSTARLIAPQMPTEEAVRTFGTEALIEIFQNMFLEDFEQEFCCAWIDEATSWITWEVIQRNQRPDLLHFHATNADDALAQIDSIWQAMRDRKIEPVLYGGIDVGRVRDLSEMILVGKTETGQMPLRVRVSLSKVEFEEQYHVFAEFIRRLPILKLLVDQNGIGMMLAERLEALGKAEGYPFTNETKELLAVEARLQAEKGNVPLPLERDLAYQIHSIKKTSTAGNRNRYDAERNEQGHADAFWAWALAVYAASKYDSRWMDETDMNIGEENSPLRRWGR